MDAKELSDNAQSVISQAHNWSFEGDCMILQWMEKISKNLECRAKNTIQSLDQLTTNINRAQINLENTQNSLTALQYSQYVEMRCQDETTTLETENVTTSIEEEQQQQQQKPSQEEILQVFLQNNIKMLHNCHDKFNFLEETDEEDDIGNIASAENCIYQPRNPYNERLLPHIYGTKMWKEQAHVGLEDDDTNLNYSGDEKSEVYSISSTASSSSLSPQSIGRETPESQQLTANTTQWTSSASSLNNELNIQTNKTLKNVSNSPSVSSSTTTPPTTTQIIETRQQQQTTTSSIKKKTLNLFDDNDYKNLISEIVVSKTQSLEKQTTKQIQTDKPKIDLFAAASDNDDDDDDTLYKTKVLQTQNSMHAPKISSANLFFDSPTDLAPVHDLFQDLQQQQQQIKTAYTKPRFGYDELDRSGINKQQQIAAAAAVVVASKTSKDISQPKKPLFFEDNDEIVDIFARKPPRTNIEKILEQPKTASFPAFLSTEPPEDNVKQTAKLKISNDLDNDDDYDDAVDKDDFLHLFGSKNPQKKPQTTTNTKIAPNLFAEDDDDEDFLHIFGNKKPVVPTTTRSEKTNLASNLFAEHETTQHFNEKPHEENKQNEILIASKSVTENTENVQISNAETLKGNVLDSDNDDDDDDFDKLFQSKREQEQQPHKNIEGKINMKENKLSENQKHSVDIKINDDKLESQQQEVDDTRKQQNLENVQQDFLKSTSQEEERTTKAVERLSAADLFDTTTVTDAADAASFWVTEPPQLVEPPKITAKLTIDSDNDVDDNDDDDEFLNMFSKKKSTKPTSFEKEIETTEKTQNLHTMQPANTNSIVAETVQEILEETLKPKKTNSTTELATETVFEHADEGTKIVMGEATATKKAGEQKDLITKPTEQEIVKPADKELCKIQVEKTAEVEKFNKNSIDTIAYENSKAETLEEACQYSKELTKANTIFEKISESKTIENTKTQTTNQQTKQNIYVEDESKLDALNNIEKTKTNENKTLEFLNEEHTKETTSKSIENSDSIQTANESTSKTPQPNKTKPTFEQFSPLFLDEPPDDDDFMQAIGSSGNTIAPAQQYNAADFYEQTKTDTKTEETPQQNKIHTGYNIRLFDEMPPEDDDDDNDSVQVMDSSEGQQGHAVTKPNSLSNLFATDKFAATVALDETAPTPPRTAIVESTNIFAEKQLATTSKSVTAKMQAFEQPSSTVVAEAITIKKTPSPAVSKLKLPNIDINVQALLPSPNVKAKKTIKQNIETDVNLKHAEIKTASDKPTMSTTMTAAKDYANEPEKAAHLLPSLCKSRVRVPVKRKSSTRAGRQESYRQTLQAENQINSIQAENSPIGDSLLNKSIQQTAVEKTKQVKNFNKTTTVPLPNNQTQTAEAISKKTTSTTNSNTATAIKASIQQPIIANTKSTTQLTKKLLSDFDDVDADDDDDFFSKLAQPKLPTAAVQKTANVISKLTTEGFGDDEDDDDLFASNVAKTITTTIQTKNTATSQIKAANSKTVSSSVKPIEKIISKTKTIFGSDESSNEDDNFDALFKTSKSTTTTPTPTTKPTFQTKTTKASTDITTDVNAKFKPNQKLQTQTKKGLFSDSDDDDDDDDLFGSSVSKFKNSHIGGSIATTVKKVPLGLQQQKQQQNPQKETAPPSITTADNPLADLF